MNWESEAATVSYLLASYSRLRCCAGSQEDVESWSLNTV